MPRRASISNFLEEPLDLGGHVPHSRGAGCVCCYKGTLLGTPNREPQDYNRSVIEVKDPGRYIPIIFLLYSWGSLFGVPNKDPSY